MIDSVGLIELQRATSGVLHAASSGSSPDSILIKRLSALKGSKSGDACFFFSREYLDDLVEAHPTVLVTSKIFLEGLKSYKHPILNSAWIIEVEDPYLALGLATQLFAGRGFDPSVSSKSAETRVHKTATVDPSAKLGHGVVIGPNAVIGARVVIGDQSEIDANVVLGDEVVVGRDSRLFAGVVIYPRVKIGDETRIHSLTTIGADGFGYAPIMKNKVPVGHQKIYHLGSVRIGNKVEIGANSSIDRGTLEDTVIEDEVKIDNNVQIGHNVLMKRGSVICGSAGMAGSSTLGEFSIIGGLTGVSNKVVIGNYAKVAAMSIVMKDMKDHEVCAGVPQRSHRDFLKVNAWLNKNALKGSKES
ncbi:MAG: UDP-3-O-(3-hydroxymyristoyl)glucosamine N-acyltransferase [Xanthomonadaceae bacterium]|nr:UDP-3-O-(3-hydroxymyristoyl)glucosamine N-acyltransferase [Xanthomonadaceae bacterium]